MQICEKKKLIMKILGASIVDLRGEKSQFMLASENDISCSIISMIERGLKDLQLTTFFKIAEALNMKPSELLREIENQLPKDFSLIDK